MSREKSATNLPLRPKRWARKSKEFALATVRSVALRPRQNTVFFQQLQRRTIMNLDFVYQRKLAGTGNMGTMTSKQANKKRDSRRGQSGFRSPFGAGSKYYGKGGGG